MSLPMAEAISQWNALQSESPCKLLSDCCELRYGQVSWYEVMYSTGWGDREGTRADADRAMATLMHRLSRRGQGESFYEG